MMKIIYTSLWSYHLLLVIYELYIRESELNHATVILG